MTEKVKTPEQMAEGELNRKLGKSIANRQLQIKKYEAEIKKLQKQIEKIKSGELVPDEGSLSTKDEDDDSSSLSVIFLLDESGSMVSKFDQTISGFNEYLDTLQKEKKKINITLTKFSSRQVEIVYSNIPVSQAHHLTTETYHPNGDTPLYDAIGKTVNKDKSNKKTLFVIMTDGEENSSTEYRKDTIVSLIKQQETQGWTFVYLGADQNAWGNAQHLGLSHGNVLGYSGHDTYATFQSLSEKTIGYSQSRSKTTKNFWK